ncbi:hypothetical protein G6514_000281 [Epicoccum nigrum]|nr:hypothetical protein G6514_000281 [Epicoccum nigrum]
MPNNEYHCIGHGGCGSVWALTSTPPSTPSSTPTNPLQIWHTHRATLSTFSRNQVFKRADGDPARSLINDMTMHLRLLTTTSNTRLPFLISQSHMILCANHPAYPPNFPAGIQPCQTYVQERIPALPVAVRETLVARYCPPKLQEKVRNSRRDEDCLVRVYCGKRRSAADAARQKRFFSLRNYNLCADQMEELGLEIDAPVGVLAKALATCYFVAQFDANGCEFVFGLPCGAGNTAEEGESVVPGRRENMRVFNMLWPNMAGKDDTMCENMAVWMLDFDCVRRISMDERGLRQAADAFWRNDPYFPRPWAHNYTLEGKNLWSVFALEFLGESGRILTRQIESDGRADAQSKYEKRMALAM